MDILSDLIKILLPATLVLLGIYFSLKSVIQRQVQQEKDENLVKLRLQSQEHILPLRLQAYERMILLLERSSPMSVLLRVNDPAMNVAQLKMAVQHDLREELNHNIAMQLYVSHQAWLLVKGAQDRVIDLFEQASVGLGETSSSYALVQQLANVLMSLEEDPCQGALRFVKMEAQQLF